MKDANKPGKGRHRIEDDEDFGDEVVDRRPRVDHDEQNEYDEWRKERGERGRKRKGHREREHHRRDDDDL